MKKKVFVILTLIALCVCFCAILFGCDNLGKKVGTCTIEIECKTILDNMGNVEQGLIDNNLIPGDGIILKKALVDVFENDSVYTLVKRVCKQNKIHFDSSFEPVFQTYYITGINHIYEGSVGTSSGWMFFVDGIESTKGSSLIKLNGGENIRFAYTCSVGDVQ